MLYSSSNNAFYTKEIHNDIPSDVVEITDAIWIDLLDAQSKGKMITSDKNGFPISVDRPKQLLSDKREYASLTFSQMLMGMVSENWLSESDGENWLSGFLPDIIREIIDTLPEDQRFASKVRMTKMTKIDRLDPIMVLFGDRLKTTADEMDIFFERYKS